MVGGKRELLARIVYSSGAASLLGQLPKRNLLLVLNYHRISNSNEEDPFDTPGLISTGDQLSEHLSYLKRHVSLVTLDEALAFVEGKTDEKSRRCRVLITFDDGYLDNYKVAFPILRSHGVQGLFFLVTSWVGSGHVPWWDQTAYLVKTAQQRQFTLGYPCDLLVNLEDGVTKSLRSISNHFFRPDNTDPERFLRELREAAKAKELPGERRRYLGWDEAREMIRGGMAVGSHTHTHPNLGELGADRQRQELTQSRALLKEQLGIEAETLSYPFGHAAGFTEETRQLARETGYRAAFSYHGGSNLPGTTERYDVKRVGIDDQSRARFRVQVTVCGLTGKYWP